MDKNRKCPICEGEFEEGQTPDSNYGKVLRQFWTTGSSGNIFSRKWDNKHDVTTYRCKNCGYLESYAK